MSLDRQVRALLSALGHVLDLNRGLADATLTRAHADLVTQLGDELDLDAGLARVVPFHSPADGLDALAAELESAPPAERLAARVRIPVRQLIEARTVATYLPRLRSLADGLIQPGSLAHADVRAAALVEVQGLLHDLKNGDGEIMAIRFLLRRLSWSLDRSSAQADQDAESGVHGLIRLCDTKLSELLSVIEPNISWRRLDDAMVARLAAPLSRMLSALTSMVGADITAADLTGIPLDGVLWSPDTRWPLDWEQWVRDNSVQVSAEVFVICAGARGTRVPT